MRELIKNLLVLLIVSFICLVLLEVTLSMLSKERSYDNEQAFELYKHLFKVSDDLNVSYEYFPDINLNFSSVKNQYYTMQIITNSQGIRDDKEIPFRKKRNTFRIIGLGDSVMFGASVDNNETFLKIMETLSANDKKKIETINFGVAASNTLQEYYYLKYKNAADYSPDLILLEFTLNDFDNRVRKFDPEIGNWYYEGEASSGSKSFSLRVREFLARFKTAKLINGLVKSIINKEDKLSEKEILETEFWINKIKTYSREKGIQFAIAISPSRTQVINGKTDKRQQIIIDICSKLDIKCLDLFDALYKSYNGDEIDINYLYWDELHPYKLGHQIIGETIYQWLYDERIIK